ncbi:hypothetical protein DY000_02048544 [Brassica cretica]|uniref:Bifunctional inhibitor/plant lipid transfer protein/seed storage helical domain-containing protein n=1 Tax=Brassica cretica TaxID=69181 RepID=A0ABQ7ES49_BRACR|nr:hypothetical protein DY000_02048544 [Brassica cretica]
METLTDASMVELEDNLKWMQLCGCNPVDATLWMQPCGCNSVDAELVDAETRGYNSMDGTE